MNKQKIKKMNLIKGANEILDETGNVVSTEYLIDILNISKSEKDFIDKVNYGITENETYVSISNNMRIQAFYKNNK